jgi:uncharacterized membrane protein YfcA
VDAGEVVGAIAIGFAAGVTSGMLGVGGGILFVPALALVLGLSQLGAESTSLLAIVPVSAVGAWRQRRYGNVRLREGLIVGALSPLGVLGGTELANAVSQHALAIAFAVVQLLFAAGLARRALRG